jgi:meso-butanediol dehydrogenase/(S,S)-butanediol dehydrogenase/diacetyl reductase
MPLEAKIALVTGAGSGIGAATALLLAQSGAVVIAADKNLAAADAVARSAHRSGWTARFAEIGVVLTASASPEAFRKYIDAETERWGRVIKENGIKGE